MIIRLFTISIFFFFLSCTSKLKTETDVSEMDLIGEVKSIRQLSYSAVVKFGKLNKGERHRYSSNRTDFYIIFDDKGNKIQENEYKSDGSLISKSTFKYNDKGYMIESNWYTSSGDIDCKWTCEYDEQGNNIKDNKYKSDGSIDEVYTYKYDDKGSKTEHICYNSDGIVEDRWS